MEHFFKVKTVEEVLNLIRKYAPLDVESVPLEMAADRVLAEDVIAEEDVPDFNRSSMDGFAVRARDTFGTSENLPGLFAVVGEVLMGQTSAMNIGANQTVRIWTGGMLPSAADAVVMLEYSREVDASTVELFRPVAPWDNVVQRGEDVRPGQTLLSCGHRLKPQDLGLLAALGCDVIKVHRKPRVALISTGDEIVAIDQQPGPGQVREVNSYTIGALLEHLGAEVLRLGLIPDQGPALRTAVARGLAEADVIVVSGGSSVGVRDLTISVFQSFPDSEILVHGVAISPGKPLIMASIGQRTLWGLPGHPVSALITADIFLRPLLYRLSGQSADEPIGRRTVKAVLSRNVPSVHGRQDYVRVRLEPGRNGLTAIPVLGKSGLISTMVKADGLITIGLHQEGLMAGTEVLVTLFD